MVMVTLLYHTVGENVVYHMQEARPIVSQGMIHQMKDVH